MTTTAHIPSYSIGAGGAAVDVQGVPAMLAAQQPDTMIDAGTIGPLTIRAASVRGVGHRYDGSTRQDDFCLGLAGPSGQFLVAVVADGVSAGARSHLAARVAVRLGVQLLQASLQQRPPEQTDWDEVVGTLAGNVLIQARKDAGDQSLDAAAAARIMATTVAFVIVPLEADQRGTRTATVCPIGDTSVWVLRADHRWESVTDVKNAGNAVSSSEVQALPMLPHGSISARSVVIGRRDVLFVMTDGVGDPLGDGSSDVGRSLAEVWATPPNRYSFAAQVDFGRRSHTDDRTVVGIWLDAHGPEAPAPTTPGDTVDLSGVPSAAADHASSWWANAGSTATAYGTGRPSPPSPTPVETRVETPSDAPFDADADSGADVGEPATIEPPPLWEPTPWEPTPWEPSGDSGDA